MELIEQAIANAVKAAGLRAESAKLADAADFHRAAGGAFLRDVVKAANDGDET